MANEPNSKSVDPTDDRVTCGLVMPIAETAGYTSGHWSEVQSIVSEAIELAGFVPKLVSSEDAVGVIQHRIVHNLYSNEIVVVDVSSKNPNVMFELGMRLAFDKPTVIVKDERTSYSFDVGSVEHLNYRSDLHYQSTLQFRAELAAKVRDTHAAAKGANPSSFLKSFGNIAPAKLGEQEVSQLTIVLDELASIRREMKLSHVSSPGLGEFRPLYTDTGSSPSLVLQFPGMSALNVGKIHANLVKRFGLTRGSQGFSDGVQTMSLVGSPSIVKQAEAYVRENYPTIQCTTYMY